MTTTNDESEEDVKARLTAAAPEMLALLREFSHYHDDCSDGGGCLNAKARVLVKRVDGERA